MGSLGLSNTANASGCLSSPAPQRWRRLARALWHGHLDLWRHIRRCWYVYVMLLLAGTAAAHYVGLNFTNSVPEHAVWLEHGARPARGDLIVFRFEAATGPAAALSGTRWLKRVVGVPGDAITVIGRGVHVNGELIGLAIERTPKGTLLSPVSTGTIPADHYFFGGTSPDSLDSRYAEIGLVRTDQLIARAHAIF